MASYDRAVSIGLRRLAGLPLTIFLVVPAGAIDGEPRLVQAPAAESELYLVDDGRRTEVVAGGGDPVRLPGGTRWTALAETGDGWIAAGRRDLADRSRLALAVESWGQVSRPAPPAAAALVQTRPVPLVGAGELAALAWLEGDDPFRLAVRAALRTADGWEEPVTVSPIAAASQTGLDGVVLADGSLLLVWSLWDGRDDELVWSRGRGDRWSDPRPVGAGNTSADVTPVLSVAGDGALLAWMHGTGESFQVMTARFDDDRWGSPRAAAAVGSLTPRWVLRAEGRRLLVRTVRPDGWSVLELDDRGDLHRRTRFETADPRRPLVVDLGRGAVGLAFDPGAPPLESTWERPR